MSTGGWFNEFFEGPPPPKTKTEAFWRSVQSILTGLWVIFIVLAIWGFFFFGLYSFVKLFV